MVKYQYAFDENEQLIFIEDLAKESLRLNRFKCISCGNNLIARLGSKKSKHFAHKDIVICSSETYLHQLGKRIFYNEYERCLANNLPFTIEYQLQQVCDAKEGKLKVNCDIGVATKSFDLTTYFKSIELEKAYDVFRPDITLENTKRDERIFIEIAVTHVSTERKLTSGIRVIEIKLKSESDLVDIKRHHLRNDGERVRFEGFKKGLDKGNHCRGRCKAKFDFFLINKAEKPLLKRLNLAEVEAELSKGTVCYHNISKSAERFRGRKFRYKIAIAHRTV